MRSTNFIMQWEQTNEHYTPHIGNKGESPMTDTVNDQAVPTMPTFPEFANVEGRRIWSKGYTHYKKSLQKVNGRFLRFGDHSTRLICDYLPRHIHLFFDYLQADGISENTINHYGAMISSVFQHATKAELISHSPRFTWREHKDSARPLYYTPEQIKAIDAYFGDSNPDEAYMRHMFTIGNQTGMRLGEVLSIKPTNLEQIVIEGKPTNWVHLPTTKSGKERYVPLNLKALEALRKLDCKPAKNFEHTRFYKSLGRMREVVLGGDSRYCYHTTRHTFATVAANDLNYQTEIIGLSMGHRSLETTRKYIKPVPANLMALAVGMMGK